MQEISSFELIYKPQSPSGAADVVLQGYFLNITNLEAVPLTFRLDFVTSSVGDPDRSLANNTIAFIDTPTDNNQPGNLAGSLDASSFRLTPNVTVPARGTAKIAVLPSDPFPTPVAPPNFEARGYVTVRLPVRFAEEATTVFGPVEPQLKRNARVLFTPQNRATYFDSNGTINDQTQASLPLATGAAIAELVPETTYGIESPPVLPDDALGGLSRLPIEVAEELMRVLAKLTASKEELAAFNQVLADAGVDLSMAKAKGAGRG